MDLSTTPSGAIGLTVFSADDSYEDTMRLRDQYVSGDVKPWVHTDYPGEIRVKGTSVPAVGSFVCMSAAKTGYHCGMVESTNFTATYSTGLVRYGMHMVCETGTEATVIPGDSGAPVFSVTSSGAYATGTQSGATTTSSPCSSTATGSLPAVYTDWVYTAIARQLSGGVSLQTS